LPLLNRSENSFSCRRRIRHCPVFSVGIIVRGMAGPNDQTRSDQGWDPATTTRPPVFAGRFYPADETECREAAEDYVNNADLGDDDLARWLGGIVPHAGWICSAAIAGMTIAAFRKRHADVVVVFGAIHTPLPTPVAALDVHRRWQVPGAEFQVAEHLQAKLTEAHDLFAVDERFHEHEHAVEVELPLIRAAWPNAMVLPVEVPVRDDAVVIGRRAAEQVIKAGLNAVYLASSDLTHYGPSYRFTPAGVGLPALEWAKDNDRRLLQLVTDMRVEQVVPEVRSRLNACGGGAIAAMMAACREHGGANGRLLRHANSFETLAQVHPQPPTDAVGYASLVIA
jgi:AmmeMemoRadiSam system protein B